MTERAVIHQVRFEFFMHGGEVCYSSEYGLDLSSPWAFALAELLLPNSLVLAELLLPNSLWVLTVAFIGPLEDRNQHDASHLASESWFALLNSHTLRAEELLCKYYWVAASFYHVCSSCLPLPFAVPLCFILNISKLWSTSYPAAFGAVPLSDKLCLYTARPHRYKVNTLTQRPVYTTNVILLHIKINKPSISETGNSSIVCSPLC